MKVVYVSTLERGGPLSHLRQLAPQVAGEGVDVRVVCATEDVAAGFRRDGVEATVASIRDKRDLRGAAGLWSLVEDADLVHTHDRRAGLFGRVLGRLRGAVVVHTLHGLPEEIAARLGRPGAPDPPDVSAARVAWLVHGYLRLESLLTSLGHVVAPSQAMADFLLAHGFPERLLHVIPYGVEPASANGGPPEHDVLVLGTAANLEYWKGIDILLDACALVPSPLRLEIYGDGALRGELEQQAERLGVDAHFHGFVPDARERLARADVFVLPSRADNLPVSILEAMAAGIPVIGSRTGGIPELVADGETGLVFEAESPPALAAAISELAADPSRRRRFGERGRERVAAYFSAEQVGQRMVQLYERLCGSST
jgi:glycosyltransferase involved in cell wall biosynthesis